MEGFNEQVVKRVNKPINLFIKIISIFLLFAAPIVFSYLAVALKFAYLFLRRTFCVYNRNLCRMVHNNLSKSGV